MAFLGALSLHTSVRAQKTKTFEEISKIALHDEKPTACIAYWWYNQSRWDSIWSETYVYSGDGMLTEVIHEEPQPNLGFQPHSRNLYAYDSAGREVSHIQQDWGSGTYTNAQRQLRYYDQSGKDSLEFQFFWANTVSGMDWDTISGILTLRTFLPNGDISSEEFSSWTTITSGSYWAPQNKTEYSYSSMLEWDTVTYFQYLNGNWLANGRKVDIVWNNFSLGQSAAFVTQLPNGGWSDVQRTTCSYNGLNSDCYTESYISFWDTVSRQQAFFDTDDELIHTEESQLQGNFWTVTNGRYYDYLRDSSGRTQQLVQREWDPQDGYVNAMKYVYSDWFVSVTDAESQDFHLTAYPNPAAEYCNFRLADGMVGPVMIELFDLNGHCRLRNLRSGSFSEIQVLMPESLENGNYIYRVTSKSGVADGKIQLRR
ncbi:MAG: Secretion system C-terminal sorting domain [Bacteroidota bacterium]|jgi:hypothetical protein